MAGLRRGRSGQSAVEFALLYGGVILPLTFGIVYVAEMYWVWHSIVEWTRDGARWAATHCWQADTQNVMTYMQNHVPLNIDQSQFQVPGTITVQYFQLDPTSAYAGRFCCQNGGADCSLDCVPDAVTSQCKQLSIQRLCRLSPPAADVIPPFPTSMPV